MRLAKIDDSTGHRTDLGDIRELADSIAAVGLLHPVVVTPELRLVAGRRRLAAMRALGWDEGPVRIVDNLTDAADLLRAEADENTCRKPYTPTEAEALARSREALLKPLREVERKEKISTARSGDGANFAPSQPTPKTRETAAVGTGYSPETIRKVREVKQAAESPHTPEPVRAVATAALADMDASGRVDGGYRRFRDAQAAANAPQPSPDVAAYLAGDEKAQDITYVREFLSALHRSIKALQYDPERLGRLLDDEEFALVERHAKSINAWASKAASARRGLRLIAGGSK